MAEKDQPGSMAYPGKGSLDRLVYRLPLLLWRMGFGPALSHPARGGRKMMVVTTRGRKSMLPRHTMVSNIYFDQKDYAVSGWRLRSDWVKNLQNDPVVTIQSGGRIYSARARRIEDDPEFQGVAQSLFESGGDSHFGDWLDTLGIDHTLADLLNKKDLVYLIGFDRTDEDGPSPLSADLIWIWAVLISFILGLIFFLW